MEFRFSERYVMALNLVLIALLAYVAALLVNHLIARGYGGPLEIGAPAMVSHTGAIHYSRGYYGLIARRDIFNLAPAPVSAAPIAATDLHLKLLGTSELTLSKPFIIVEDSRNGEQSLYRLGDKIPDAGKLIEVGKNSAIIDHDGTRLKIEIPSDLAAATPVPALRRGLRRGPAGRGIREIGAGRYQVSRATVNQNLNNMGRLFTQIRAIPNFVNGRTDGFKLSEIQSGSIFQQMGLRDGDILTDVGGQPINNPAMAMQMLTQMRNSSVINLTVMRNGEPMNLRYEIR